MSVPIRFNNDIDISNNKLTTNNIVTNYVVATTISGANIYSNKLIIGSGGIDASAVTQSVNFGTNIPTISVNPTYAAQLANKGYVDNIALTGYIPIFTATNTWSGQNDFTTKLTASGGIQATVGTVTAGTVYANELSSTIVGAITSNFINNNSSTVNITNVNSSNINTNRIVATTSINVPLISVTTSMTAPSIFATTITGQNIYASNQLKQASNKIAFGTVAGETNQGTAAVAIGENAGYYDQQSYAVAVGQFAGQTNQSQYAVAIGQAAGQNNQGKNTVALGPNAGQEGQQQYSVAIGGNAGTTNLGEYSIAIGYNSNITGSNTIFLNASGTEIAGGKTSAFYVSPIRGTTGIGATGNMMLYDSSTKEITTNDTIYIDSNNVLNVSGGITASSLNASTITTSSTITSNGRINAMGGISGTNIYGDRLYTGHEIVFGNGTIQDTAYAKIPKGSYLNSNIEVDVYGRIVSIVNGLGASGSSGSYASIIDVHQSTSNASYYLVSAPALGSGKPLYGNTGIRCVLDTNTIMANVVAPDISATNITAANISGTTIYANHLTAANIMASIITGSTIYATTLESTHITAANISGTNIYANHLTIANTMASIITGSTIYAATLIAGNPIDARSGLKTTSTVDAYYIDTITITGQNIYGSTGVFTNGISAPTITTQYINATTITGQNIYGSTGVFTSGISAPTITTQYINATTITGQNIYGATSMNTPLLTLNSASTNNITTNNSRDLHIKTLDTTGGTIHIRSGGTTGGLQFTSNGSILMTNTGSKNTFEFNCNNNEITKVYNLEAANYSFRDAGDTANDYQHIYSSYVNTDVQYNGWNPDINLGTGKNQWFINNNGGESKMILELSSNAGSTTDCGVNVYNDGTNKGIRVHGQITATGGITGSTASFSGQISARGGITGSTANFSGNVTTLSLNGTTGSFSSLLSTPGGISGSTANFSGNVTTLSLNGTTGSFSSLLSTPGGISGSTASFSGNVTTLSLNGTTGSFSSLLSTPGGITGSTASFSVSVTAANVFATRITGTGIYATTLVESKRYYYNDETIGTLRNAESYTNNNDLFVQNNTAGKTIKLSTQKSDNSGNEIILVLSNDFNSIGPCHITKGGIYNAGEVQTLKTIIGITPGESPSNYTDLGHTGAITEFKNNSTSGKFNFYVKDGSSQPSIPLNLSSIGIAAPLGITGSTANFSGNVTTLSLNGTTGSFSGPLSTPGGITGSNVFASGTVYANEVSSTFVGAVTGNFINNNSGNINATNVNASNIDTNTIVSRTANLDQITLTNLLSANTISTISNQELNISTPGAFGGAININSRGIGGLKFNIDGSMDANNQFITNVQVIQSRALRTMPLNGTNASFGNRYFNTVDNSITEDFFNAPSSRFAWLVYNSSNVGNIALDVSPNESVRDCGLNVFNDGGTNKGIRVPGNIKLTGANPTISSTNTSNGILINTWAGITNTTLTGEGGSYTSKGSNGCLFSFYADTTAGSIVTSAANTNVSSSWADIIFRSSSPAVTYFKIGATGIHIPNNSNTGGNVFASGTVYTTDLAVTDSNMTLNNGALYIGKGASTGTSSNLMIGESGPITSNFTLNTGYNTLIGNSAGRNMNGNAHWNTYIGNEAGEGTQSGSANVFIGNQSGHQSGSGDGNNNVALGTESSKSLTSGNLNTTIGRSAGSSITSGSNNTCIGENSNFSSGTLTYSTVIGAGATGATSSTIQLGRSSDNVNCSNTLSVAGTSTFSGGIFSGGITGSTASFSGLLSALGVFNYGTSGNGGSFVSKGATGELSIYSEANGNSYIDSAKDRTAGSSWADIYFRTNAGGLNPNAKTQFLIGATGIYIPSTGINGANGGNVFADGSIYINATPTENAPSLIINNVMKFVTNPGLGYNPIVQVSDSLITTQGGNNILTLTTNSATSSGIRITTTNTTIGAGGTIFFSGATPTSRAVFDSTSIQFWGGGVNNMSIASAGVQIGTGLNMNNNPITAGGTVTATSFNATSDYRIKENVVPLSTNYSVDNLNPVHYYNKSSKKEDIGFIAHEVQEEFPCLVTGEKDGAETQSLNYNGLIPILVKEIKELKERVKFLEEQIKK